MSYEVELKARVANEDVKEPELKKRIDSLVGSDGHYIDKEDIYFHLPNDPEPSFRIRDERNRILVTAKEKHKAKGVECNKELEFIHENVSDKDIMLEMASHLGYEILRKKRKTGWEWHFKDVHIELLCVTRLGWFLEMETISEDNSPSSTEPLKHELFDILSSLGYSEKDIEARGYNRMLKELDEKDGK